MGKMCPNCGNILSDQAKFCPKCGTKQETQTRQEGKFCLFCGATLEPGARFCSSCGRDLTVSYTHLDVYKRQCSCRGRRDKTSNA